MFAIEPESSIERLAGFDSTTRRPCAAACSSISFDVVRRGAVTLRNLLVREELALTRLNARPMLHVGQRRTVGALAKDHDDPDFSCRIGRSHPAGAGP